MCLGLATGYREPTENKERTYADLKQTHFPENKIDTELTSDDFLKALEYVKEYEQAIKEEQDFLKNGDEFHVEALKVCEIVKQALEKRIPKKTTEKTTNRGIDISGEYDIDFDLCCPICGAVVGTFEEGVNEYFSKSCDNCGQALDWSDSDDEN